MLVLSGVRRLLKSALEGEPLPIYSSELFEVTGIVREHGRTVYNCRALGVPLSDAFFSTCP
jgi:hypothetical protein